jgi:hypothetical protein
LSLNFQNPIQNNKVIQVLKLKELEKVKIKSTIKDGSTIPSFTLNCCNNLKDRVGLFVGTLHLLIF